MPELPEIEHLKRSLEPWLLGAWVLGVDLRRRDVVHPLTTRVRKRRAVAEGLLMGDRISKLIRHGKNLALLGESGRVVCIHLGMSGQMRFVPARQRLPDSTHVHCVWQIESSRARGRLIFRDPRRFGGLWTFPSLEALMKHRFAALGPDALCIQPGELGCRLRHSHRAIKAALLDQSVLAGVGNIYADESLFKCRIHPMSMACRISAERIQKLAGAIREVLQAAINAGGSTIRSYADAAGKSGGYAAMHQVYGRGGKPCYRCSRLLTSATLVQRTTVFCGKCQLRLGRTRRGTHHDKIDLP